RLRAIVEAENAFDDGSQRGGNGEIARAATGRAGTMTKAAQAHAESGAEIFDRPAELYHTAGAILADDLQPRFFRKIANFLEFFPRLMFSLLRRASAQLGGGTKFSGLGSTTQQNADFDVLGWVGGTYVLSAGHGRARAALEFHPILSLGHAMPPRRRRPATAG